MWKLGSGWIPWKNYFLHSFLCADVTLMPINTYAYAYAQFLYWDLMLNLLMLFPTTMLLE
jgi:hypothetical protein